MRRSGFVGLAVVALLVAAGVAADRLTPSPLRRELPRDATDIREFYDGNWNGDYIRVLRARVRPEEVPAYAARFGLTERYSQAQHAQLPISFAAGGTPPWWTPPASLDGAHFRHGRGSESFTAAQYAGGCLYVVASTW